MNDTLTVARRLGRTLDNCLCDRCPAAFWCYDGPTLDCRHVAAMQDDVQQQADHDDEQDTRLAAMRGVL